MKWRRRKKTKKSRNEVIADIEITLPYLVDPDMADVVAAYSDFTELTAPMINEFVSKIIIHKAEGKGADRTQEVEIYLNYIGKIEYPSGEKAGFQS